MTDRSFQRANDESRERIARLVATLTPTRLAVDLGEGWTVRSALAHMGFWDRWQAGRWTEILAGTWSAAEDSIIAAEHLADEALYPYWEGIGADDIPALALQAATELDALIARAPDPLVDALEGTPSAYLLHRYRHREEHIDHIERTLATIEDGAVDLQSGADPGEIDRAVAAVRPAAPSADRSYAARNQASLSRLRGRLAALDPADLDLPVGDGAWTIGHVLGHLAFWDRVLASRWRAALAVGPGAQPAALPPDLPDLLNDALPPTWEALARGAGRAAITETLAAAEAVNAIIAGLPGEAAIATILSERPALLDRSIHRSEHLEAMDEALAAARR